MNFHTTDDERLQNSLAKINKIVLCDSFTRDVDAAGTAEYRAELTVGATRSHEATVKGRIAFERLLEMAETRNSGQIKTIARFLWATWHGGEESRFDIFDLRGLDTKIADDILSVIDAIRWRDVPVYLLAENLDKRMPKMLECWDFIQADSV